MVRDVEASILTIESLGDSNAALQALASRYAATLNNVSQGVCFFDGEERLILCNRRYAEIYNLTQEQVRPGATFSEIVGRLETAGAPAASNNGELMQARLIIASAVSKTWVAELPDGRAIQIGHHPMPGGGWVATHEDISELTASRSVASERLSLQALIDCLPDYLWVKDSDSRFVVVNRALALDSGRTRTSDMIGLTDFDLHPYDVALEFRASELGILRGGQAVSDREELVFDDAGNRRWLSSTKVPLHDEQGKVVGLFGNARDITARKLASLLREGQARLLERMAISAPLNEILEQIALLVEFQLSGIFCAIMLLSKDGALLQRGAAPSLSDTFAASDGIRVGPKAASCGTAIFRKEAVAVTDITADPLWGDYQHLAAAFELRSCWSTPIMSRAGDQLGTVAMYSRTPHAPTDEDNALARLAVHMAGIAIDRQINDERLRAMASDVHRSSGRAEARSDVRQDDVTSDHLQLGEADGN